MANFPHSLQWVFDADQHAAIITLERLLSLSDHSNWFITVEHTVNTAFTEQISTLTT